MPSVHTAIAPPPKWLAWIEGQRASVEFSALALAAPYLQLAPRGDGHPVLVLPGFVTSDASTWALRRCLSALGYDVHAWELGRNIGPRSIGAKGERLEKRLEEIHAETGRKVTLVGWSLGGIMARELARSEPESVRQVITLGSPFTGNPHATNVSKLYAQVSGEKVDDPRLLAKRGRPPPVPSTAIYSKTDGIVAWRNCQEPAGPQTDNIEVRGSHFGLVINPAALFAIADRLSQPEDRWTPFARSGWRAAVFPSSGHLH